MLRELLMGTAAGAVGTTALNLTTYGDMAVRGRPSSSMPQQLVEKLAGHADVDLQREGEDQEKAESRTTGLASLLGYVNGLGVGAVYGLLRPHMRALPSAVAGIGVGLAAMAASDVPLTAAGLTDPRQWDAKSWAMDVVPHMVFGLATAAAYEAMDGHR